MRGPHPASYRAIMRRYHSNLLCRFGTVAATRGLVFRFQTSRLTPHLVAGAIHAKHQTTAPHIRFFHERETLPTLPTSVPHGSADSRGARSAIYRSCLYTAILFL